jgi:NADPH2:quinone reductase
LLGINSVNTPSSLRRAVWNRIGSDLKPQHLDTIGSRTISFDDLPDAFQAYIDGTVIGRTVVEISAK